MCYCVTVSLPHVDIHVHTEQDARENYRILESRKQPMQTDSHQKRMIIAN